MPEGIVGGQSPSEFSFVFKHKETQTAIYAINKRGLENHSLGLDSYIRRNVVGDFSFHGWLRGWFGRLPDAEILTLPMLKGSGFLVRRSLPRYFAVARKAQKSYTISPSVLGAGQQRVVSSVSHRTYRRR